MIDASRRIVQHAIEHMEDLSHLTSAEISYFRNQSAPHEKLPAYAELLAAYGSFRRLTHAYWTGALGPECEAIVEDKISRDELVKWKPVCA